jgi:hypothetical protein
VTSANQAALCVEALCAPLLAPCRTRPWKATRARRSACAWPRTRRAATETRRCRQGTRRRRRCRCCAACAGCQAPAETDACSYARVIICATG